LRPDVPTLENGEPMRTNVFQLDLDQRAAGQILESLAERLLRLERLREDEVDEDVFADRKNDAVELRQLYEQICSQAVITFGGSILSFSATIGDIDEIYDL
jgi:hypothetical protein